jgi:hypothetical protein
MFQWFYDMFMQHIWPIVVSILALLGIQPDKQKGGEQFVEEPVEQVEEPAQ